jgi:glycosyltransferase involved in cell wall biosynthesis
VTAPLISVVIPTYQRCASVRRLLLALSHQTVAAAEYEVIVPIDGSDDGTREMIDRFDAPYRLVGAWQPNRGRAAARNAGVRLARGRIVVFLDDDMEPLPGFLRAHLDAHPPGSRRAVIGPVPIHADASSPPIVHFRQAGMDAHLARLAERDYRLGFRDIYSGNLSLPRELLNEIGGFDETFTLYGHEDYELALRLVKAGAELDHCPAASALQHYEKDFADFARDCLARGRTAVLFARKHPDVASTLQLAAYRTGPLGWRTTRAVMLLLTRAMPAFPAWVIAAMEWLERHRPRRLPGLYRRSLDYFFWVGAKSALRESTPQPGLPMRLGIGLLALAALVMGLRVAAREVRGLRRAGGPDEITRYEARFQGLRQVLPASARVGYLTEPAAWMPGDDEGPRLAFKRLVLTQYALLPAILVPESGGALAVGNFDSLTAADSVATRGFTVVRDLGNGVLLLRRPVE